MVEQLRRNYPRQVTRVSISTQASLPSVHVFPATFFTNGTSGMEWLGLSKEEAVLRLTADLLGHQLPKPPVSVEPERDGDEAPIRAFQRSNGWLTRCSV